MFRGPSSLTQDAVSVGNFPKENVTVGKNSRSVSLPGELSSTGDLKPGHSVIVRRGLTKVAAYRDDAGQLYDRSAARIHIGCHLHWNSFLDLLGPSV
jgi:hypothetical protein